MIGICTTLSTISPQTVRSQVELVPSTEYLFNTKNIVKMQVEGTTDSLLNYSLNIHDDQIKPFILKVDETNAAIKTIADTSPSSELVSLDVFVGKISFHEVLGTTPVTKYFNVDDINKRPEDKFFIICVDMNKKNFKVEGSPNIWILSARDFKKYITSGYRLPIYEKSRRYHNKPRCELLQKNFEAWELLTR